MRERTGVAVASIGDVIPDVDLPDIDLPDLDPGDLLDELRNLPNIAEAVRRADNIVIERSGDRDITTGTDTI